MYNNTNLGDLIAFLECLNPKATVKDGFGTPHSDRGSYDELAFTPEAEAKVEDMLAYARSADGGTYTGWKGGEYRMNLNTPVYIGRYGSCGTPITPHTFKYWELTATEKEDSGPAPFLEEGDVIYLARDRKVYATVPERLVYDNRKGSDKPTHAIVTIEGECADLEGTYVVYKTATDGGGTGHGPYDTYPDGHHVFCERLDDPDIKVDFYQSGCFTSMITDLRPIGKANRKWIMER